MLKAKIHRARVTDRRVDYEGSVTIDGALLQAVGIRTHEQVQIYDISNGERFLTYAIEGEAGSGVICVNGAAARLVDVGDYIIIANYGLFGEEELEDFKPSLVMVDEKNQITERS